MCVLIFSTTFVWNISHFKKNWARYDHKCMSVCTSSSRYSCHILMKLEFSRQIFEKKNTQYQISWKCVDWEPTTSMRADGRTDITKQIVAFRNFANVSTKQHEHQNERQRNSAAVTLNCGCRQQPLQSSSMSDEALNHLPNGPLWPMTASSTVLLVNCNVISTTGLLFYTQYMINRHIDSALWASQQAVTPDAHMNNSEVLRARRLPYIPHASAL